MIITIHQYR